MLWNLSTREIVCVRQVNVVMIVLQIGICIFNYPANNNAKEQVKVVEEWSAEHPRKTRQSVFLEQYPEAYVDEDGLLQMCPTRIVASYRLKNSGGCAILGSNCKDCRKAFWMEEV